VRVVDASWSGASDNAGGSGLLGYSFLFDASPFTLPDLIIDLEHTADPHETSSAMLPDGGDYRFHLRTCDRSANCTSTVHLGRFRIDATSPPAPTNLTSPSHAGGGPVNDPTIDMSWTPPVDNLSGLVGYGGVFDGSAAATCSEVQNLGPVASTTSAALDDGTWYFHLCAVDAAGNWSSLANAGPFVVETAPPQVLLASSVAATADGVLVADELVDRFAITKLAMTFDEPVSDPVGSSDPNDVTNPANYRLIGGGPNGSVESIDCGGLVGDDVALAVDAVAYAADLRQAMVSLNGGVSLPEGEHALFACAGIEDEQGNALDGNGDATPGDDYRLPFVIAETNVLANPNLDATLTGWMRQPPDPTIVFRDDEDADGSWASGAVHMASAAGTLSSFVFQCVPVSASQTYRVDGLVRIDAGGNPDVPTARSVVQYYSATVATNCTIGPLGPPLLSPDVQGDTAGVWEPVTLAPHSPPTGAQSAQVFFLLDAASAGVYDAWFDNLVYGSAAVIFASGFESGDLSGWVVSP
jgi:hypothetical protein